MLGIMEGATENATVVKGLLESMVERVSNRIGSGCSDRRGKALRAGIDAVYGKNNPVQLQETQGEERHRISAEGNG